MRILILTLTKDLKVKKEKNKLAQEEFVLTKIERTKITELINECEFSFNVDELLEFSKKQYQWGVWKI